MIFRHDAERSLKFQPPRTSSSASDSGMWGGARRLPLPRRPLTVAAVAATGLLLTSPLFFLGSDDTETTAAGRTEQHRQDGAQAPSADAGVGVSPDGDGTSFELDVPDTPQEDWMPGTSGLVDTRLDKKVPDVRQHGAGKDTSARTRPDSGGKRPSTAPRKSGSGKRDTSAVTDGKKDSGGTGSRKSAGSGGGSEKVTTGWESTTFTLGNVATGDCLARPDADSREVGQLGCGSHEWTRYATGKGYYLLKHVASNRCADTDGSTLYLSSCTTADTGQRWTMRSAGICTAELVSVPFDGLVTGWNDGTASVSAVARIDDRDKGRWSTDGLTSC